jgi:hypothetical protein
LVKWRRQLSKERVMALLDDVVNGGNLVTGVAVGAGALVAWPLIRLVARPVAKSLIKGGLIAYRGAEQLYAGAVEGVGDRVSEAQQEIGAKTPAESHPDGSTPRA